MQSTPELDAIRADPTRATVADVPMLVASIDALLEECAMLSHAADTSLARYQEAYTAKRELQARLEVVRGEWTALGQALLDAARELRQTGADAPLWAALMAIDEKEQAHAKRP